MQILRARYDTPNLLITPSGWVRISSSFTSQDWLGLSPTLEDIFQGRPANELGALVFLVLSLFSLLLIKNDLKVTDRLKITHAASWRGFLSPKSASKSFISGLTVSLFHCQGLGHQEHFVTLRFDYSGHCTNLTQHIINRKKPICVFHYKILCKHAWWAWWDDELIPLRISERFIRRIHKVTNFAVKTFTFEGRFCDFMTPRDHGVTRGYNKTTICVDV